ncbi:hypothetical protein Pelo_16511 [Pelomyxa schiedti]|nr:hypothetical protein Pelo_16511 [Pelomyxa schiedti]
MMPPQPSGYNPRGRYPPSSRGRATSIYTPGVIPPGQSVYLPGGSYGGGPARDRRGGGGVGVGEAARGRGGDGVRGGATRARGGGRGRAPVRHVPGLTPKREPDHTAEPTPLETTAQVPTVPVLGSSAESAAAENKASGLNVDADGTSTTAAASSQLTTSAKSPTTECSVDATTPQTQTPDTTSTQAQPASSTTQLPDSVPTGKQPEQPLASNSLPTQHSETADGENEEDEDYDFDKGVAIEIETENLIAYLRPTPEDDLEKMSVDFCKKHSLTENLWVPSIIGALEDFLEALKNHQQQEQEREKAPEKVPEQVPEQNT